MSRSGLERIQSAHSRLQAKRIFLAIAIAAVVACGVNAWAQSAQAAPAEVALPHGEIQYLWPEGAPGATGTEEQDKPHLEVFNGSGAGLHPAVVVCPGGGYTHLAYEKEGVRVAEWLNLRGITAFVLTYRLAPRYKSPAPMLDGERAVRWVRNHAAEYKVDSKRVGMWGFSAGGHLVGMVGTHFDAGNPQATDPVERMSDRPDFVVSAYGVMALDAGMARKESLENFTSEKVTPELIASLSPAQSVTRETPPFFLYATTTDARVPALSSVAFYVAMVRAGAPVEMHIFEQGPHGTGLAQEYPALSAWTGVLENWLRLHDWIGASTAAVH